MVVQRVLLRACRPRRRSDRARLGSATVALFGSLASNENLPHATVRPCTGSLAWLAMPIAYDLAAQRAAGVPKVRKLDPVA